MASATHSDTYRPSEDEPFMNDRQKEYFRRKLLNWKDEILQEARETLTALQTESEKSRRHRRPGLIRNRSRHRIARP